MPLAPQRNLPANVSLFLAAPFQRQRLFVGQALPSRPAKLRPVGGEGRDSQAVRGRNLVDGIPTTVSFIGRVPESRVEEVKRAVNKHQSVVPSEISHVSAWCPAIPHSEMQRIELGRRPNTRAT